MTTPSTAMTSANVPAESFGGALKLHYATFFSLMGGWMFDALDATIYAYAVPGIMADMKVSLAKAFSVVSVFFLCAAVGGVLIVVLAIGSVVNLPSCYRLACMGYLTSFAAPRTPSRSSISTEVWLACRWEDYGRQPCRCCRKSGLPKPGARQSVFCTPAGA